MTQETNARKWLGLAAVVIVLAGIVALAFRFFVTPELEKKQAEAEHAEKFTGDTVRIIADAFKGYAVLRTPEFQQNLQNDELGLDLRIEEEVDYNTRVKALESGDAHMAVITIGANLIQGNEIGRFPGYMAWIIDESFGADGIVCYKQAVANVEALNRPDARIIVTPDSPSETLTRHMILGMLPKVAGQKWHVPATSSRNAFEQMQKLTDRTVPFCYALWEPELSMAEALPDAVKIYDSSQTNSAIVDVMLVSKEWLAREPAKAQKVITAYFRALHHYAAQPEGIAQLFFKDGQITGERVTMEQAKRMALTIRLKNLMENYAHYSLVSGMEAGGLPALEVMTGQIGRLLEKTGKFSSYPASGRERSLMHVDMLGSLKSANFHPGGSGQMASVRKHEELGPLTPAQWDKLVTVGNMNASKIEFQRSRPELSISGKNQVQQVVDMLGSWPTYYLEVVGNARAIGDAEANKLLAANRAKNVVKRLVQLGVSPNRVRAVSNNPNTKNVQGQDVTFRLKKKSF